MKVGIVIDRLDPARGGAERALVELTRVALAAGHEVDLFAMSVAGGVPARLHRVAVPPSPRGVRDVVFAKRAVAAARAADCDVVVGVRHVTGVDVYWPHGGVHAETLAAVERSKGRIRGAVSRALHRVSPKQRALLALERRFFEDPGDARIWCVSRMVEQEIVSRWPNCAANVERVANAVDTDAFHPHLREEHRERVRRDLGIEGDVPLLLFLGGAWRLKGWPVLVEALRRARDSEWVCVAAGARHLVAARTAARAGLRRRTRVLPRQDVAPLYGAADLFVQPTWRDPCSIATLEALACGVPVVTTEANGAAEEDTRRTGAITLVPAGDPAVLAAAVCGRLESLRDAGTARTSSRSARAVARPLGPWHAAMLSALERAAT